MGRVNLVSSAINSALEMVQSLPQDPPAILDMWNKIPNMLKECKYIDKVPFTKYELKLLYEESVSRQYVWQSTRIFHELTHIDLQHNKNKASACVKELCTLNQRLFDELAEVGSKVNAPVKPNPLVEAILNSSVFLIHLIRSQLMTDVYQKLSKDMSDGDYDDLMREYEAQESKKKALEADQRNKNRRRTNNMLTNSSSTSLRNSKSASNNDKKSVSFNATKHLHGQFSTSESYKELQGIVERKRRRMFREMRKHLTLLESVKEEADPDWDLDDESTIPGSPNGSRSRNTPSLAELVHSATKVDLWKDMTMSLTFAVHSSVYHKSIAQTRSDIERAQAQALKRSREKEMRSLNDDKSATSGRNRTNSIAGYTQDGQVDFDFLDDSGVEQPSGDDEDAAMMDAFFGQLSDSDEDENGNGRKRGEQFQSLASEMLLSEASSKVDSIRKLYSTESIIRAYLKHKHSSLPDNVYAWVGSSSIGAHSIHPSVVRKFDFATVDIHNTVHIWDMKMALSKGAASGAPGKINRREISSGPVREVIARMKLHFSDDTTSRETLKAQYQKYLRLYDMLPVSFVKTRMKQDGLSDMDIEEFLESVGKDGHNAVSYVSSEDMTDKNKSFLETDSYPGAVTSNSTNNRYDRSNRSLSVSSNVMIEGGGVPDAVDQDGKLIVDDEDDVESQRLNNHMNVLAKYQNLRLIRAQECALLLRSCEIIAEMRDMVVDKDYQGGFELLEMFIAPSAMVDNSIESLYDDDDNQQGSPESKNDDINNDKLSSFYNLSSNSFYTIVHSAAQKEFELLTMDICTGFWQALEGTNLAPGVYIRIYTSLLMLSEQSPAMRNLCGQTIKLIDKDRGHAEMMAHDDTLTEEEVRRLKKRLPPLTVTPTELLPAGKRDIEVDRYSVECANEENLDLIEDISRPDTVTFNTRKGVSVQSRSAQTDGTGKTPSPPSPPPPTIIIVIIIITVYLLLPFFSSVSLSKSLSTI